MLFHDLSLSGVLESLATKAWSKPCWNPESAFLLSSVGLISARTPDGLWQTLGLIYQHARIWAPGLDIPAFVPPVNIAALSDHAGYFAVDAEAYAGIAVAAEFLESEEATLLILAHEACHHILLQSGIAYQFKNNTNLNERVTDAAMFVCGFGEIVRRGHSVMSRTPGGYTHTHLGYLTTDEYGAAFDYVLNKRRAEHLPGIPSTHHAMTAPAPPHTEPVNRRGPLMYLRNLFRRFLRRPDTVSKGSRFPPCQHS